MAILRGLYSALAVVGLAIDLTLGQTSSSQRSTVISDCVKICYSGVINQDGCAMTDLRCDCQQMDSLIDQMPKCIQVTPECKGQDPAVFTDAVRMYCKQILASSFSGSEAGSTSTPSTSINPGGPISSVSSFPTSVPGSMTIQNPSDTVPASSQGSGAASITGDTQTPPASTQGPGPVSVSTFSLSSQTSSNSAVITVSGNVPVPIPSSTSAAITSGVVPVPTGSLPSSTQLGPSGITVTLSTSASAPICTVTWTGTGTASGSFATGTGCGGSGANTTTTFNLPTPTPTVTIIPGSAATTFRKWPFNLVYIFAAYLLIL